MSGDFLIPNILQELGDVYKSIPLFGWLLVGHSFFAVGLAPQLKDKFLLHYWATFLGGFSGSIVSALLIMDPKVAPISLFTENAVAVIFSVCWWLRTYSPYNIVDRILSFLPFSLIIKAMSNFMKCQLIVQRVDLAVKLYPGVIISPLLLGTLAGTSGKLVLDLVFYSQQVSSNPPEVVVPSFLLRSGFMIATTYYVVTHIMFLMSGTQAMALVTTCFVVHGILQDVVGLTLDVTYPVAKLAHAMMNIPEPFQKLTTQLEDANGDAKKND